MVNQKTYQQVADKFDVSRERIRQILLKALHKLRHPSRMNIYMVLTDQEVGYDPSVEEMEFDIDKLSALKQQKIERIQQEKYDSLTKQEKDAVRILPLLMRIEVKEFLKTLNITNEGSIEKLTELLKQRTFSDYHTVESLLGIHKEQLEEKGLQEVIDAVTSIGLHFEEDFEYIEDFNNACYTSMINVGLDTINAIFPGMLMQNIENIDVLDTTIEELNLSIRSFNCLKRAGKNTIRDLVMTKDSELITIRNLRRRSYEETLMKIRSLGFDICPEEVEPKTWIRNYEKKLMSKEESKSQKKLDIKEVPEDYRKAYAFGVGLLVEEEMKKGLISRVISTSKTKLDSKKPNVPKVKHTQEQVNDMSDKQVLKAIGEDISVIDCLETSFIVKYRKELIKMILADSSLDIEKRFEILELVNEAKVDSLTQR